MRIAFFTHYAELYGANRSLINLIIGLQKFNVQSYVLCPCSGNLISELNSLGVPVSIIPFKAWTHIGYECNYGFCLKTLISRKKSVIGKAARNILCLPTITRQLKKWKIDVVYTNSSVISIGFIASRFIRKPHVWHIREFCDLDYGQLFDFGKPISYFLIKKSDVIIMVSKSIKAHFFGSKEENQRKLYTVYNGIASQHEFQQRYEQNTTKKRDNKEFIFSVVGLLHPGKGQREAIRAFAVVAEKYPNVKLLLVGGGKTEGSLEEKFLRNLCNSLSIQNKVSFLGYVKDMDTVYEQSDVILMCSRNEAMGRVTVEAMSFVRPVIGYDNAGTSEIIKHGYTGLLYRGEHLELANCMLEFIEDPAQVRLMGENAWKDAFSKYSIENYVDQVYVAVSQTLRKRG